MDFLRYLEAMSDIAKVLLAGVLFCFFALAIGVSCFYGYCQSLDPNNWIDDDDDLP